MRASLLGKRGSQTGSRRPAVTIYAAEVVFIVSDEREPLASCGIGE